MRLLLPTSLLLLSACGSSPGNAARFNRATWPVAIGPQEDLTLVRAPSEYDGVSELPLIVLLHGYGANADVQDRYLGLSARVDELNFVTIAPNGTEDVAGNLFWNATPLCCDLHDVGVDHVSFLLELVDELEATMPIDPDRISFVGHSNGGFMSYRMACEVPDRIASIGSLAGLQYSDMSKCGADSPVSVLQIHGDADNTVPIEGGREGAPSALASAQYWADLASCGAPMAGEPADYITTTEGAETTKQIWPDCSDGAQVEFWTLGGAGHIPYLTEQYKDDLPSWLLAQRR